MKIWVGFVDILKSVLSILVTILALTAPASSAVVDAEDRWKDSASSNAPFLATSIKQACTAIDVASFYQGSKYVSYSEVSYNSGNELYSVDCVDSDGDTFRIFKMCWEKFSDGSTSLTAKVCPKKPRQICTQGVGNPTDIQSGIKYQYAIDWASSKDGRFRIQRNYRSDMDHIYKLAVGTSYAGAPEFAGVWRLEFAEILAYDWDYKKYIYKSSDGSRYTFNYARQGSTDGIPLEAGHPYKLKRINNDNVWIEKGDGRRDYYKHRRRGWNGTIITNHFQPKTIQFSDGYEIKLTHTSPGRVSTIRDNKGQFASFTYQQNVVSNTSRWMLKYVDIDTDYNGTTLNAEYRIEYFYTENSMNSELPMISEVRFTDNASNTTETTAKYAYDANAHPPQLVEIYDGRLDGTGNEFAYASFTYQNQVSSEYAQTASSAHFGGADGYTFGANDGVTASATNSLGRTTNYSISQINDRPRVTQINGVATSNCLPSGQSFDYTPGSGEPEGYLYSKVEKNGSTTTYTRDSRGLVLTKTEDVNGTNPRVTTYTWHSTLRLPLTRATSEMTEAFTYNVTTDGEVQLATYSQTDDIATSPTYGQTRIWTYSYTTLTSGVIVLSAVDGPGLVANGITDVTTYDYDADGNLIKATDPNGLITEFLNLDKMGQPTLVRMPDGIEWGLAYDHRGRIISTTHDPNGANPKTASYTYDVIGQMLSSTDLLGRTTSYEYDEARRLVKTTNPVGDVAEFEYDLMGNLTRTEYSDGTNPAAFWQKTEYDELGRLLKTIGAMGQIWQFSHDVEDNLDSITDPTALQTAQSFDALNRLTDIVDRANFTTSMEHNDADQVTTYTDPRGIDTGFTYNGFGEVLTEVSADRGSVSYSYSTRGLVTSMTDGNGAVTNYSYDDGGRMVARSFPSDASLNETYTYNTSTAPAGVHRLGKLSQIADGSGTTARDYATGTGYISSETRTLNGIAYQTQYDLDIEGNLTTLTYPSGHVVTYTHDNMNRVTRVQVDLGSGNADIVQAGASYLPNGPLTSLTYGDGAVLTAYYDLSYRLTGLEDDLSGTKLRDVSLTWSNRDNLASVTNTLDPLDNRTFDYTAREFMEDADGPWGELDYTYDSVGNRLTRLLTVSGSTTTDTYSYPATSNLLQSVAGGQTRGFTYDGAGNVTYDARSGVGYGYSYNAANRMSGFSINGVVQAEYEYNAFGQQVMRTLTQTGQIIHSIHDLDGNRIAEYDYDDIAQTSSLIREYVWMNGQMVAVIEGGSVYYVRTDHIGRPVFATNSSGTKVWTASYLPFGGVHTSTGSNINLRFPGQWFQSESGLHQNWMRDYDPTTGRYLQADPLGLVDGASVYGYALQNPGRWTDPTGEFVPAAAAAGRAALWCWRNTACRSGATGLVFVMWGWLTDEDCTYTWSEGLWDFGIGAAVGSPYYWWSYRSGGGGARAWRNGPGVDWHRFGLNGRQVNRPHYHAGKNKSQMKKHRPWQGGWSLGGWRPW